jgi:uncharacterized membrane protein YdjX (TVP38/TMEM64 family)
MTILFNIFMWIGLIFTTIAYVYIIKECIEDKARTTKDVLLTIIAPLYLLWIGFLDIVNYDDGL